MIKKIGLILIGLALLILFSGCSCRQDDTSQEITLTYWRIFDDEEDFKLPFANFQSQNKNIKINYVKKDPETYEKELVNALAEGSGPDLFMIRNDWLPKHKNKLAQAPEEVITPEEYSKNFVSVAYQDFVQDDQVWGIPLSIDSLALFANRDLLTKAGIQDPPENWNEFIDTSKALTKKEGNTITLAGSAMGAATNVSAAVDILTLLMLQNGTNMVSDDKGSATFQLPEQTRSGEQVYPGTLALDFYTSFARPNKETYTWNASLPDSIEAFVQGKAAMAFGYSYHAEYIKNNAPELKFGIYPMPQIKGTGQDQYINYGLYWTEVVSSASPHTKEAWELLKVISSQAYVYDFLESSQRASSLTSLAQRGSGSTDLKVFSRQALTVKSWYKGDDPESADGAFEQMIEDVVSQNTPIQTAIDKAAATVTSILQKTKTTGD